MKIYKKIISLLLGITSVIALFLSLSCAQLDPYFDPASVQAKDTAPVAAQVEVINIPYDQNLPRYVVAIEPFENLAQGSEITSGDSAPTAPSPFSSYWNFQRKWGHHRRYVRTRVSTGLSDGDLEGTETTTHAFPGDRIGEGIAAQYMTALTHWGNVSVVDWAAVSFNEEDGTYSTKLGPGEVGPFIIRGSVTEFNETSDMGSRNREISGGVLGAVASSLGHGRSGMILSQANPTYKSESMVRNGMVGLDLTIMDGRNARILRSCNCSGTFTTKSATSGLSVFGIGGGDSQFAASALGQATRAAMNDAVKQTSEVLKFAPR